MTPEWSEVLDTALALPPESRARLAKELLASLSGLTLDAEEEAEVAAAMAEAEQNEGVDAEEFFAGLRAELGVARSR